ncbi:carbonic anhydrase [Aquitalea magnusonii]|uniref:Carbonic anhydrase n=2 Tax=Aquitalea magnusonii TaxID=332411 RepID=A0A318J8D2_9NEIS|nr:carbonic anhydrase [Aquitalea magnusonii]
MNRQGRNAGSRMVLLWLGLGMLGQLAVAEDKVGAPIVLPGKQSPTASAAKPAAAEAASAPLVSRKTIILPTKLAASMAAARAKPKEPEAMAPEVKQAPAPEIKALHEPSPEVHAPGSKPHAKAVAHKKPARHRSSRPPRSSSPYASQLQQIREQVARIMAASSRHFNGQDRAYFRALSDQQAARATVVSCSDSSVPTDIPAKGVVDGLYLVRAVGNQLQPMVGTIEYGIRQLHTPVLIFASHAACASIKAVAGEEEPSSADMATVVHHMGLPQGIDSTNGALLNINNQVEGAILTFSGEVEAGRLAILGGYFDWRNDLKRGSGKLIITNLNGETDPARIRQLMKQGQYFSYSFMH